MQRIDTDFYESISGLGNFFGCARKYKLAKEWRALKVKPWLELGSQVHALMDNKVPNECWPKAIRIAERLVEAEKDYGFKVLEREVKETVTLAKGLKLVRIIDVVGEYQGEPVLLDYKVPNKPWYTINRQRPKAMGFQPPAYLFKRPEKKMYFLVAPADDSPVKAHLYESCKGDEKNVIQAVRIVRHASKMDYFPYNRGFQCKWCDFANMCYGKKGWEDEYTKRS